MSHCVSHERCPACAKLGKDRNNDNLGIYADGSAYCFSCGYHCSATGVAKIRNLLHQRTEPDKPTLALPPDCDVAIPGRVREWLSNYSLTQTEIKLNHLMWSDYWQRLIFPYFIDNQLVAWQGRYFGEEKKSKWYSQGNLHDFVYVVGNKKQKTIVLTEDIISAICVARIPTIAASPIFGSHISTKHLLRLKNFYDTIVVWLDKDKEKEATQFSQTARLLGINSRTLITDKDPKEYKVDDIQNILSN